MGLQLTSNPIVVFSGPKGKMLLRTRLHLIGKHSREQDQPLCVLVFVLKNKPR